jgi:enoyl-CoA hydratase/carnithine racemase
MPSISISPPSSSVVTSEVIELPNSGNKAIIVSINRPSKNNCFNSEVVLALSKAFQSIAEKSTSTSTYGDDGDGDGDELKIAAVIFTGKGSSFCAGADLSNPPNPLIQSSDLPECLLINPVHQMSRIPVPIIGAVHGHVITGGFELALACDILVGDDTVKFRDTHVKFGLAPCWGLSQKLSQRVGPGRAKLISYSAKPVPAKLAYEWGIIDEIVSSSDSVTSSDSDSVASSDSDSEDDPRTSSTTQTSMSLKRAIEIADTIGSQDLKMVRRYKKALEEGGKMELGKGLQRERELGIAHYVEVMNDGNTFENAKEFISSDGGTRSTRKEERPRIVSKL